MPSVSDQVSVTVVSHPVAAEALTHLRDETTSNQVFRSELRRLSLVLVTEATRLLPTVTRPVRTPLGIADGVAPAHRPVLVPILRAGLGMLSAATELLPDADIAMVGVQRDEVTHEPSEYVAKLPGQLGGRTCIVLDPMLATGGSLAHTCRLLAERGAAAPITVVCVLASPEGIEHLRHSGLHLRLVTAAVDSHLDARAFIVPGLGDAGDRLFGPPH
jgi:uracil phosphoribosyltransferase